MTAFLGAKQEGLAIVNFLNKLIVSCKEAVPGADPGFQVRGGARKKIAPSGGRREIFGVFRVKNHDFTPKNHIFPMAEGGAKIFGVFRVKNHDFTPKNHIFFQF
jgi:hypothetical protein